MNKNVILKCVSMFLLILSWLVPLTSSAAEIHWQKWSKAAFEQASRENKMILVNVGIEVCYACKWMEEGTYQVPGIANLVMQHFVPIQVDANARPDLGERYSDWAWPATIFMDPQGTQVLALRGSRRPKNFLPVLNTLIEQHANNALAADKLAPYVAPEKAETSELSVLRDRIRASLDADFDDVNAGWGDALKEINGFGRMEQLFMRAFIEADDQSAKRAVATAEAMMGRLDPVWGGFFPAGESGWTDPITEKRTGSDATAMMTFAAAYQITNDKKFLLAASNVDRFLRNWMMSDEGTFYTSQEGELISMPAGMSPADYFNLGSDAERRKHGTPPIDHTVYTDLNARVIKAYVELYEAAGNQHYLQTAIRAADAIIKTRLQNEGWLIQVQQPKVAGTDVRIHLLNIEKRPLLRAQVEFGVALLSLYRATGEARWLNTATKMADVTRRLLEDPNLGGFYATSIDSTDTITPRRKPLQDNGTAARFYYQLSRYTKNKKYVQTAEKAVRATVSDEILNREGRIIGNLAVALETLTANYVEFSIVGVADDPAAKALFAAARKVHDPRKIQHFEKPGRYPDLGRAAVYICNPTACSIPIFKPEDLQQQADKFVPVT